MNDIPDFKDDSTHGPFQYDAKARVFRSRGSDGITIPRLSNSECESMLEEFFSGPIGISSSLLGKGPFRFSGPKSHFVSTSTTRMEDFIMFFSKQTLQQQARTLARFRRHYLSIVYTEHESPILLISALAFFAGYIPPTTTETPFLL